MNYRKIENTIIAFESRRQVKRITVEVKILAFEQLETTNIEMLVTKAFTDKTIRNNLACLNDENHEVLKTKIISEEDVTVKLTPTHYIEEENENV